MRAELETHFGLQPESLERCRDRVQELLRAEVTRITEGDGEEDEDEDDEAGNAELATPVKKRRRRRFGHRGKKKSRTREAGLEGSQDEAAEGTAVTGLGMP